jgi:hypothetical protein
MHASNLLHCLHRAGESGAQLLYLYVLRPAGTCTLSGTCIELNVQYAAVGGAPVHRAVRQLVQNYACECTGKESARPVELNLYTGCQTMRGAEPCTSGRSSK